MAPLVDGDDGKPGGDEPGHDEVPEPPLRRQPVQQHDHGRLGVLQRRTLAPPHRGPQPYASAGDVAVLALGDRVAVTQRSAARGGCAHEKQRTGRYPGGMTTTVRCHR